MDGFDSKTVNFKSKNAVYVLHIVEINLHAIFFYPANRDFSYRHEERVLARYFLYKNSVNLAEANCFIKN